MRGARTKLMLALVAAPLMLWSCAESGAPVAPETEPRASSAVGPDLSRLAVYRSGNSGLTIGLAWRWIGPEGGSLRLGDFEVVVPAGAVASATRFTIRLDVSSQTKDHVLAEFGPHGQSFAVPVTLRTPYAGTTAEGQESRVLWWNGRDWLAYASTVLEDGRLETRTDHFSDYGTEDTERGYIVVGG